MQNELKTIAQLHIAGGNQMKTAGLKDVWLQSPSQWQILREN